MRENALEVDGQERGDGEKSSSSSSQGSNIGCHTSDKGAGVVGGGASAARDGAPAMTTDSEDVVEEEEKKKKQHKMSMAGLHSIQL